MSLVGIYHDPFHIPFNIVKAKCPSFSFEEFMLAAMKNINNSTVPDFIVPTLLMFETMLRLGTMNDRLHPDIAQRALELEKQQNSC